jgi:hypothetical protein
MGPHAHRAIVDLTNWPMRLAGKMLITGIAASYHIGSLYYQTREVRLPFNQW